MAEAPAPSAPPAPAGDVLQEQLDALRSLGKVMVKRVSTLGEDAVQRISAAVGLLPAPPTVELHGAFALEVPGLLGMTKLDPRSFMLVRGMGKETVLGGGGAACYELQSTDAKGVLERVVLQKTDEVKGLDHRALAFTLVSAAHDGEPPTTRRYKFTDKETFSTWAHGLMVAIKFSERRTRRGSLVQLMGSSDGQAIKVSADL